MFIGGVIGAFFTNYFNTTFINYVYIIIASLAFILMFIKIKPQTQKHSFHKFPLIITGFIIGIVSGIIGAGGAFIIVPVLLAFFKLPMNVVVTNSIIIAFISSIGSFVVKLFQGFIPIEQALFLIIGSVIFAPIGLNVGIKISNTFQKWLISILIFIAITQLMF